MRIAKQLTVATDLVSPTPILWKFLKISYMYSTEKENHAGLEHYEGK